MCKRQDIYNADARAHGLFALTIVVSLFGSTQALSAPYDISLRGVGRPKSLSLEDEAAKRYRALGNELALALSPRPLAPAETLGINGFEFSFTTSATSISADEKFWQGQPGTPVFEGVSNGGGVPGVLWNPGVHVRKGLPMSMELGFSGSYLTQSGMFMLGVEYKIAWFESFWRWVPALATRVSVARLFGASDLDVITAEGDLLTSLPIGVAGTVVFTPYLGYGQLFAHLNSQVLDETPYIVRDFDKDQRGGSAGSLYNFATVPILDNAHTRLIAGLRLNIAFLELIGEVNYLLVSKGGDLLSVSMKLGFDV
jgi:hypothetical protein